MLSDEQVVTTFARLRRNEPVLWEWLHAELERHKKVLVTLIDERQVRVTQGCAQTLQQIIKMMDECGAKHPG